jgi:hypothetical protein
MPEPSESRIVSAAAAGRCPTCDAPRPDLSTPCATCGAPALGPAEPAPADRSRQSLADTLMQVRMTDIEPYTGLRYLSKLFRLMALILLLVLIAEVVVGLNAQGTAAIPTLLGEMSRLIVLAGLLWGAGDLAILLIDVGHDVRAARILIGRQAAHHVVEHHERRADGDRQDGRREDVPRPVSREPRAR